MNDPFVFLSVFILETFNATNFSTDWVWYAFQPYIRVLGQFFFACLFLIPGVYIYEQSDRNTFQTAIFLIILLATLTACIPTIITMLIGLFIGFILTGVLVSSVTNKRRY